MTNMLRFIVICIQFITYIALPVLTKIQMGNKYTQPVFFEMSSVNGKGYQYSGTMGGTT